MNTEYYHVYIEQKKCANTRREMTETYHICYMSSGRRLLSMKSEIRSPDPHFFSTLQMGSPYLRSLLKLRPEVTKDPRNLPEWRKRLLLGLVCFIAIIPGFCSTIYVRTILSDSNPFIGILSG